MNLESITAGIISAVNTPTLVSIQVSTGFATESDGTLTPNYNAPVNVYADIQALGYTDLQKLSSLNVQGERWKLYFTGNVDGLVRSENKGGDIVTVIDPTSPINGNVYLIVMILEHWPSMVVPWTSAAMTLQNGS